MNGKREVAGATAWQDAAKPAWHHAATPAWHHAATPAWASGLAVPAFLALREGTRPLVVVAPHGGRRQRPIRRGDSVNDLETAGIGWELAARLGAHAIVNHGLDRNDIDLNRITHLVGRAPSVLALLASAIDAAAAGGGVPFVLFVHGWNMVVPCCDIGIGLRRRAGQVTGRHPTLSRERYDGAIAAIERELGLRGISAAVGRRYTASGRDNAAQLFSGRFADHDDALVAALGRRALEGRVDAAQLELGIPLRWPGAARDALIEGLAEALAPSGERAVLSPSGAGRDEVSRRVLSPQAVDAAGRAGRDEDRRADTRDEPAPVAARTDWRLPAADRAAGTAQPPEPGLALQAVLDREGRVATFCGVEATGPRSMAARFSIVCSDGTMMLLVGEGEWSGVPGRYALEGFSWEASPDASRVELTLRAPMIRYPTHDAYLDLEQGLAGSRIVDADVRLVFEAASGEHGRLHGSVRAGDVALEVDTIAFADRRGRRSADARHRLRVVCARGDGVLVEKNLAGEEPTLQMKPDAGALGVIRRTRSAQAPGDLQEAEVVARVPVWRPIGEGLLVRWTFGIVRCRHAGSDSEAAGLFESLEVFGGEAAETAAIDAEATDCAEAAAIRGAEAAGPDTDDDAT